MRTKTILCFGMAVVVAGVALNAYGAQALPAGETVNNSWPEWITQETFIEKDGRLIYTGCFMGGADYVLTLRLAKSEAAKSLLESVSIRAQSEFSTALDGYNRRGSDTGRYVTDAIAWTVDNLKVGGIKQRRVFYEKVFDPQSQSYHYNAWVQLTISREDYVKAKTSAAEKLLDKTIREKDKGAKEKALELLKRLRGET